MEISMKFLQSWNLFGDNIIEDLSQARRLGKRVSQKKVGFVFVRLHPTNLQSTTYRQLQAEQISQLAHYDKGATSRM